MPHWVEEFEPYEEVNGAIMRTGTILRRVPFPALTLAHSAFSSPGGDKDAPEETLSSFTIGHDASRNDVVQISTGVVVTPDCDIYSHKCNAVVVVQMLTPDMYFERNPLNPQKRKAMLKKIVEAQITNPGVFESRGLVLIPKADAFEFPDSLAMLESHVPLPIRYQPETTNGFGVTEDSVGGAENIWLRISNDGLRQRLVNEFARHLLRIGLEDAT